VKKDEMGEACGTHGEEKYMEFCLGNLKERNGWKHNSEMDLNIICWDGMDWIHLAQYRCVWWAVMKMVMNLLVA